MSYTYSDTGLAGHADYHVEISDPESEETYLAYDPIGRTVKTLYSFGREPRSGLSYRRSDRLAHGL